MSAEIRPETDLSLSERLVCLLRGIPLAALVVVVGAGISLFAWSGLRGVENSQAIVDQQRRLLTQGSELRSGADEFGKAILQFAQGVQDSQSFEESFASFDRGSFRLFLLDAQGAREWTFEGLVEGIDENLSAAGPADIEWAGRQYLTLTLAIPSPSPSSSPSSPGPSSHEPSKLNATPTQTFVGQLDIERVFAGLRSTQTDRPASFDLLVDGQHVFSTGAANDSKTVGESVVFVQDDAQWVLQGNSEGLYANRTTSWLALLAGLAVSGITGLLLLSTRSHAMTVGRLERSEYDASHDPLTGLLNRAGITERLERVLDGSEAPRPGSKVSGSVGILFLDLDRLKVINDSMGHRAGDEVLAIVAKRLRSIVREQDTVGRFGGDEFVVVCDGIDGVGDLTGLAERALESLKEPAMLSDQSTKMLSGSIGISYGPILGSLAEDLLRDADSAMHRAKADGGARFEVFDSELRAQALARLEVEQELRSAIRLGQLVVHYQPIVDLDSGEVNRVEALVRWNHPKRGMIPPGEFLSVAAESGLIVDVGEHVLREACRQSALWSLATGRKVMVSVNVAERQLLDAGLVDTVRRVLKETGIEPSQLELELTEELIVDRLDNSLSILYELVNMGVQLAIDDFGTSRASLGQLKRLDMVSTLKIDRAFVIDVATHSVDRKIITAIVALAASVGMEVVAEGVEDRDQVCVLRSLGVDKIQGYYFQRPAPGEQMATILTKTFAIPEPSATERDGDFAQNTAS